MKIIFEIDGNAWCAHYEDFVDLQTSIAGFGNTPIYAFWDLLKQDNRFIKVI